MASSITIASVGDFGPLWPLSSGATQTSALQALAEADLTMANLEVPLTAHTIAASKPFSLRADPEVAGVLRDCGVDVVTVANNHSVDFGPQGLLDTIHAASDVGVAVVGGGRNLTEAMAPALHQAGGLTVAVLGLASTLPPGFAAGQDQVGIAPVHAEARYCVDTNALAEQPGMAPWVESRVDDADLGRAVDAVEQARAKADLVVVQIHWGVPHGWVGAFQSPVCDYQRVLGHALVDAGADLVLGHHPHFVHGVERYGRGVIAYSLSHFLFHAFGDRYQLPQGSGPHPYDLTSCHTGAARDTVLFTARADADGVSEVALLPTRLDPHGEPVLLSGDDADPVLDRFVSASAVFDTKLERRDGRAVLDTGERATSTPS